eukprot:4038590-Amphidinium_carterae.1
MAPTAQAAVEDSIMEPASAKVVRRKLQVRLQIQHKLRKTASWNPQVRKLKWQAASAASNLTQAASAAPTLSQTASAANATGFHGAAHMRMSACP